MSQLVDRDSCSTKSPMETLTGLNLNHHDMCLFNKTAGGEGLPALNKFLSETLQHAVNLVALRTNDCERSGFRSY